MIIFPNALILSEAAAGRPLTYPRIGYQTYTFDLDATSISVSSEDAEGPRDGPIRPDTYEYWQPTTLPATWTLDLGVSRDMDYVGIVGNLCTAGAAIKVETWPGSGSPDSDYDIFASELAPDDDAPILFLDDSRIARYVRLTLTGGSVMPKIAVVYVGEILSMQRSIYGGHVPITLSRDTVLNQTLSRGGHFLGQSFRRHGFKSSAAFRFLTPAWTRSDFDPFVESARQYPYFFAWRPQTYPREVGYCWAEGDIVPSNSGQKDFMQVSWAMRGYGGE